MCRYAALDHLQQLYREIQLLQSWKEEGGRTGEKWDGVPPLTTESEKAHCAGTLHRITCKTVSCDTVVAKLGEGKRKEEGANVRDVYGSLEAGSWH